MSVLSSYSPIRTTVLHEDAVAGHSLGLCSNNQATPSTDCRLGWWADSTSAHQWQSRLCMSCKVGLLFVDYAVVRGAGALGMNSLYPYRSAR